MANDFVISGSTQSAISALLALKRAFTDADRALLKTKTGIRAQIELAARAAAEERQYAAAVNLRTNAILKSMPAMQRQIALQKEAAKAARTAAMQGEVAARMFLKSQGMLYPQKTGATADEAMRFNRARQNFVELNRTAQLTSEQMKMAASSYHNAAISYLSLEKQAAIEAYAAMLAARKNLGASQRAEAAKTAAAQNRAMTTTASATDKANQHAKYLILTWKSIIRLMSVQFIHLGLGRFVSAIFEASREMAELTLRVAEIRTISRQTQLSFNQWRLEIEKLAGAFGRVPTDVAEGVYQTLSNQVAHGAQALQFMNEALIFSRVAHSTTAEAVNLGTAAINSFRLSSQDARTVYAQLMATIELGRVRAEEIATTYGRVGSLAHVLRVEMGEMNAMISTLSRVGIPANETMTLMNQVMLKLIRPTKAMQSLFNEWGVSSGAAAIQTFSLVGILQKVEEAAVASGDRLQFLGDIYSRVRAIRGGAVFDTATMKQYLRDFEKIKNSTVSYQEQIAIAFDKQNITVKLQQMWQTFKVYLMERIIRPIMIAIANMGGKDGITAIFIKVKATIQPLINVVKALVVGFNTMGVSIRKLITFWLSWKIAAAATMLVMTKGFAFLTALILKLKVAIHTGTVQITLMKIAMTGLVSVAKLGLTAAIALIVTAWINAKQAAAEALMLAESAANELKILLNRYFSVEEKTTKTIIDQLEKRKLHVKEVLKEQYQAYFVYTIGIRKLLRELADDFENQHAEIAKAIKKSYDIILENIQKNIDDIKSKIEDAKSTIEETVRAIRDLPIARDIEKLQLQGQLAKDLGDLREYNRIMGLISAKWATIALNRAAKSIKSRSPEDIKATNAAFKSQHSALLTQYKLAQQYATLSRQKGHSQLTGLWEARRLDAERAINDLWATRLLYAKHLKQLEGGRLKDQEAKLKAQIETLVNIKSIFAEMKDVMGKKPSEKKGETIGDLDKLFKTKSTALITELSKLTNPAQIAQIAAQIAEYKVLFKRQLVIAKNMARLDKITTEITKLRDKEQTAIQKKTEAEKEATTQLLEVSKSLRETVVLMQKVFPMPGHYPTFHPSGYETTGDKGKYYQRAYGTQIKVPVGMEHSVTGQMPVYNRMVDEKRKAFIDAWKIFGHGLDLAKYLHDLPAVTGRTESGLPQQATLLINMKQLLIDAVKEGNKITGIEDPQARAKQILLTKGYLKFIFDQLMEMETAQRGGAKGSYIAGALERYDKTTGQFMTHEAGTVGAESLGAELQKVLKLADMSLIAAKDATKYANEMDAVVKKLGGVLAGLKLEKAPFDRFIEEYRKGLMGQEKLYDKLEQFINKLDAVLTQRGVLVSSVSMPGAQLTGYMSPNRFVTVGDINITVNGGSTSQQTAQEIGLALRREIRRETVGSLA